MEHTRCWLAAYTRSRHENHVASQLSSKGLEAILPTYISDCVEGLMRLMASGHPEPLNLGTEELVSVNGLVDMICAIAGKRLTKRHDLSRPQGVRGRNSDNSRLREVLGWEPQTRLLDGLDVTYHWIEKELQQQGHVAEVLAYASD
jgi:GDP-D-mannose 3', 5'-epimerase